MTDWLHELPWGGIFIGILIGQAAALLVIGLGRAGRDN